MSNLYKAFADLLKSLGGNPDKPLPPDWETVDAQHKTQGPGWNYAPGANAMASLREMVEKKLIGYLLLWIGGKPYRAAIKADSRGEDAWFLSLVASPKQKPPKGAVRLR